MQLKQATLTSRPEQRMKPRNCEKSQVYVLRKVTTRPRGPEMTEVEPVLDFASSGRSGRRNALPDILGSPAGVNPGDLPLKLAELSLKDGPGGAQSPTVEEPPASPESSEGKEGS
ncbi:cAMP-dependent protein kinase inhibitor beta [Xiphias gladius]|uniref:cAMP-dependent protein kinase inhibitor beta n=1 Tax=Xiphias gladius TaxID=8245 RepID=UPI001A998E27|nr:cAMP-dependent protein kinase inhibitor beta [Xiphias gladius]